jgi:hypothetical protein
MSKFLRLPAPAGQSKKDVEKVRPVGLRHRDYRLCIGIGVALILAILLSMHLLPDKVTLQVGDVSPEDIQAHRTVRYIDSIETENLRRQAAATADKVYDIVPKASSEASDSVSDIFYYLHLARNDASLTTIDAKESFVKHNLRLDLSDGALQALLQADNNTFDRAETYTKQLIKEVMDREIRDDNDDVKSARSEFHQRLANYLGSERYAGATAEIGNHTIRPNRIFNEERTKAARAREMDIVPPQYKQIIAGQVVIGKGERVTPQHMDQFMALGLRNPKTDYLSVICIFIMVFGVVILSALYMARYHSGIFASNSKVLLLALIVLISVLGLKLGGSMLGLKLSGLQLGYFAVIWISLAGMLTAILLNPQLAILVVSLLSMMTGVALDHELRWALAAVISSLVAIYAVSDIRNSADLVRGMVAVCLTNLALVWVMGEIGGDTRGDLLVGSGWAVVGGLTSVGLFWLGTAALEKPFGVTTHRRLLELSDTNNPMFKRLLMEAPGTYSHSIYVGNIASMAADEIGADALLVRVASYYHDVGKIKRPNFFVENQHVENVHDRLNPSLSALVIRSHIKDGLELAKEYGLPPVICDLMSQHHGTGLVRYFYQQAAGDLGDSSSILEQQFRYDGVKPQTRESALLMLADSVEAASRTLSRPTPGQIENMVDGIIAEKLNDGQLDECDLTFKDISRIRASFVRTLTSMMHARIEYPEMPGAEGKKGSGNGSSGKELAAGAGGSEAADGGRREIAAG